VWIFNDGIPADYWYRDGVEDEDLILKSEELLWENISGDQSTVGVGGFNNDAGYITAGDVPIPTLHQVTGEGNVTTNFIEVNGISIGKSGVGSDVRASIHYTGNQTRIYNWLSGNYTSGIIIDNGQVLIFNRYANSANPGGELIINQSGNASFVNGAENAFIPVSGADAISDDDFVTKRQLDSVSPTSLLTLSADTTIDWQDDEAPDADGNPSGQTYAQRFGNTPQFQVWLQTSPNNFSLETVPITMTLSGGNIAAVNIDTSGIAARIIIK